MSEGIGTGIKPEMLGVDFAVTPVEGIIPLDSTNRRNILESPNQDNQGQAEQRPNFHLDEAEVVNVVIRSFDTEKQLDDGRVVVGVANGQVRPHGWFTQRVERTQPLVDYLVRGSGILAVQKQNGTIVVHEYDDKNPETVRVEHEQGDILLFLAGERGLEIIDLEINEPYNPGDLVDLKLEDLPEEMANKRAEFFRDHNN